MRLKSRRIGRVRKVKADRGRLGGRVVLDAAEEVVSRWGLERARGARDMHLGEYGGTYAGRCGSIAGELLGEVAGGPSVTDGARTKERLATVTQKGRVV